MAKPRIPLPKQVGGAHRAETDYDRRREKQVSLEGVCLRDGKMTLPREMFDKGQLSKEDFEQAILRADRICQNCQDPICRNE